MESNDSDSQLILENHFRDTFSYAPEADKPLSPDCVPPTRRLLTSKSHPFRHHHLETKHENPSDSLQEESPLNRTQEDDTLDLLLKNNSMEMRKFYKPSKYSTDV